MLPVLWGRQLFCGEREMLGPWFLLGSGDVEAVVFCREAEMLGPWFLLGSGAVEAVIFGREAIVFDTRLL